MAETINIVEWLLNNWIIIYLVLLNIFWIFLFVRLRIVLGPFLVQSVRVAFGLIRDPNLFLHFLNSKTAILEWRPYNQVMKIDPEDPTSEFVYIDRENGFSAKTPVSQKGFLDFSLSGFFRGKKKNPNEFYSDEFVPVKIDHTAPYFTFGRQLHVIYEGQNITQNPLKAYTQDEQVKKAGIGVEYAIQAFELIAQKRMKDELATKTDVRNWSVLSLVILGIIGLASVMMLLGLQEAVNGFIGFAGEILDKAQPLLEQALKETPRVVVE